jgi:hypothetical protein
MNWWMKMAPRVYRNLERAVLADRVSKCGVCDSIFPLQTQILQQACILFIDSF